MFFLFQKQYRAYITTRQLSFEFLKSAPAPPHYICHISNLFPVILLPKSEGYVFLEAGLTLEKRIFDRSISPFTGSHFDSRSFSDEICFLVVVVRSFRIFCILIEKVRNSFLFSLAGERRCGKPTFFIKTLEKIHFLSTFFHEYFEFDGFSKDSFVG